MRAMLVGLVVAMASVAQAAERLPRVLFLTHSAGWKHSVVLRSPDGSLSWAEKQLQKAAKGRLEVVATQDLGELTREKLKGYQGVVFYTTGELDIDKEALIEFVRNGGGFAGVHSATDTFYKYAPYGELIGGYFDGHPWHEKVTIKVEDRKHPPLLIWARASSWPTRSTSSATGTGARSPSCSAWTTRAWTSPAKA